MVPRGRFLPPIARDDAIALRVEVKREGIAKAKSQGKYRGRKPTALAKREEVLQLRSDGVRPVDIAQKLDISRASVYRLLNASESLEAM